MAFKIVVVCTGNVCRSPMAERLLDAHLGDLATTTSAGTHALVGQPMTQQSAMIVLRWRAGPATHVARQLDERVLAGADLVLTATREHRAAVLEVDPSLVRRTFTVREAGRLAALSAPGLQGATPAERLVELRDGLAAARARWAAPPSADDDVEDPYGLSDVTYARVAGVVCQAVGAVVDAVKPPAR